MANNGNLKPFQKGHDPRRNIKGRLPFSETNEFKDLLWKYLNKEYKVGGEKVKAIHIIAERVVDDAVRGKLSAIKFLTDRIEGKAPTAAQMQQQGALSHGKMSDEERKRLTALFSDK